MSKVIRGLLGYNIRRPKCQSLRYHIYVPQFVAEFDKGAEGYSKQ